MKTLLGFILFMTPILFVISLMFEDTDIWDALKCTLAVDLGLTSLGLGILIMADGGLLPL